MREGFFHRRIALPILELLRQGVTPEKIALSIALGAALGVFPAIGWTTALCAIAALLLRLNLPAIQIVNYFMYPAQLALLIPFFRLGEKLFRAPHLPISPSQLQALIHAGLWLTIRRLWTTTWHAMAAWLLLAPVFVAVVYAILVPVLRRVLRKQTSQSAESE
jgi:uncharacterized protein (DUF2062 family)